MIIALTIVGTLMLSAGVAYAGARVHWARTQVPGRHRQSYRRSPVSDLLVWHAGRALEPFRR